MTIKCEYTSEDIKELVLRDLRTRFQTEDIVESDVLIQVKSKQNYKSEWEIASFRATIEKTI
jgi:hypothetical protein